jgi:hypothetical protein
MASTYSTNLKIELQATGENSGTWGSITNTNLGTALEQAIVGYGNPSFASDANLTLTYTDTNAAQAARALVLNVTSAVSLTATRELVVPTIQKQYIVQNNTTGSQSITVKTSGGTGITVPNGRKAHLYVDGTNVIQMFDFVDINGGAIDGTTVGASSASTGAFTTLTASGAVTFSATTQNISLGASQTTGTFVLGGTAATGAITLDASTKTHTLNVGSGATENALTKTINIGTGGVSGSTTTMTIGSANGTTITLNGTVTAATFNSTTIDTTNLEVTNIKAKDGTAVAVLTDSTGATDFSKAFTLSATTQNISLGASQTTGTFVLGGTAATGAITLDASTKTHTLNVGSGATENALTKTINIGTSGVSGSTTTMTIGSANGTTTTINGAITASATTQNISLGASQTTGTFTAGGTAATGTITIDASTKAHTLNVGSGATESATTKTINFGTAGVSGSTTTINLGSAVSGSTTGLTINAVSTLTPIARTSGATSYFTLTTPADTTRTASTESIGANFTAATRQWATGALTLQRERVFAAPTYAFVGASTLTTAINVDIATPAAGTNATITNAYALRAGASLFTGTLNIVGAGTAGSTQAISFNGSTPVDTLVTTSSGDVGLGTSTPTQKLDVRGSFYVERNTNPTNGLVAALTNQTTSSNNGCKLSFDVYNIGSAAVGVPTDNAGLAFYTNGVTSEKMRLDASGNLGIGTSSPSSFSGYTTVSVNNATNGGIYNILVNGTETARLQAFSGVFNVSAKGASTVLTFETNGSERMRLDSSGNLGLGVTPSAWGSGWPALQVFRAVMHSNTSDGRASFGNNYYVDGTDARYIATAAATQLMQASGEYRFFNAPSGTAGNAITFTQAMTLDADGDLGIGTTSPAYKLEVNGVGGVNTSNANAAEFHIKNTSASARDWVLLSTGSAWAGGGQTGYFNIYDNTAAQQRLTIDTSGNLGLGVTPTTIVGASGVNGQGFQTNSLTISAYAGTDQTYFATNANTTSYAGGWTYRVTAAATRYDQSSGSHIWYTAPSGTAGTAISFTQAMTLDASGNLGVGATTVSPTGLAILSGGQGKGVLVARNATGSPTSGQSLGSYAFKGIMDGVNSNVAAEAMIEAVAAENQSGSTAATNLLFYTKPSGVGPGSSPTERARITSGGYFKASDTGTYNNSTGSFHELYQTSSSEPAVVVTLQNASYVGNGLFVEAARNTTNNSFYAINYYNSGAVAFKFRVADSGNVTNTNGTYGTISDQKMKTDIVDAGSQWSDIKALRFRKFKMKDDPSGLVQLGVVAQEVELTSPGLVDEHQDRDAEGNDLGTTTKSVKTSVLLMKAAVALQEAMARIETLEAEVAALKGA